MPGLHRFSLEVADRTALEASSQELLRRGFAVEKEYD
jgi:hypothetical protein